MVCAEMSRLEGGNRFALVCAALISSALLGAGQHVIHSARVKPSLLSSGLDALAIPDLHEAA